MVDEAPRHLAGAEQADALRERAERRKAQRIVPLVRRLRLTFVRLLRTWSGRAVFAAGLIWLPLGMGFLNTGAEQDLLFGVSLGVIGFGCFFLVLCGWRRDDDPDADPREQGYWDWRPDAGLVAGTCLVAVGLGGLVGSLF
ncbi:MAG TPA: hypothetical protein VIR30_16875 [Nocardioides sp.]